MKRIATLIAAAALLNACGGGSEQAESQASASSESMASSSARLGCQRFVSCRGAPSIVIDRIDRRLRGRTGDVDVCVSLERTRLPLNAPR